MKKSLVVLLIAVLALSAVFADPAITATGEVAASYAYDFDDEVADGTAPALDGTLSWSLENALAKQGSSYPYINVAGDITVDLTATELDLTPEVSFTAFEIVGDDWKINFLDSIGSLDYAVSAIDTASVMPRYTYFSTSDYATWADAYELSSAADAKLAAIEEKMEELEETLDTYAGYLNSSAVISGAVELDTYKSELAEATKDYAAAVIAAAGDGEALEKALAKFDNTKAKLRTQYIYDHVNADYEWVADVYVGTYDEYNENVANYAGAVADAKEYASALADCCATTPVRSGRDIESALTYSWLTGAELEKAVSFQKDGIGKITVSSSWLNEDDDNRYSVFGTPQYMTGKAIKQAVYTAKTDGTGVTYYVNDIEMTPGEADKLTNSQYYWVTTKTAVADNESETFAVEAESDVIGLADSVTTQFGFGFAHLAKYSGTSAYKNGNRFGFSSKTSYEDILTVAADFGYDFGDKTPEFDVATKFAYDMVTIEAYYANKKDYLSYADAYAKYGVSKYVYNVDGVVGASAADTALLSVKATVDVEEIGTKFTFTGKDLLGKTYRGDKSISKLSAEIENTYFENYTFTTKFASLATNPTYVGFKAEADYSEEVGVTAYANVYVSRTNVDDESLTDPVFAAGIAYEKNGLNLSVDFSTVAEEKYYWEKDTTTVGSRAKFGLTAEAAYEAASFTVESALEYNTHEVAAYAKYGYPWYIAKGLYYSASIKSDKLVDGATLSLAYESDELLAGYSDKGLGSVTAACTVEF